MNNTKLFFPNLNGVRAIAASLVIFFHIELIKREFGYADIMAKLDLGGEMGVILFFVLSGFLITYLLLDEEYRTQNINLKNFYIRRILRIWPLYFLVVLTGLFVLPHISFMFEPPYHQPILHNKTAIILLYLFFSGNVLTGFYSHVNFIRPTWSVSVEEQFYIFWPILLKFSKNKAKAIRNVFITYWLIRILLGVINTNTILNSFPFLSLISNIEIVWIYTPFDALSIGAFSAYILFTKKQNILNFLFQKNTQMLAFISVPILLFVFLFQPNFNMFNQKVLSCNSLFYALLFAICVINLAGNKDVIISLENKFLSYLGKISYGLYMYHWIVIVAVINVLRHYKLDVANPLVFNLLMYSLSLFFTFLISHLSYNLFEVKLIRLKRNYSVIISGDMTKEDVEGPKDKLVITPTPSY